MNTIRPRTGFVVSLTLLLTTTLTLASNDTIPTRNCKNGQLETTTTTVLDVIATMVDNDRVNSFLKRIRRLCPGRLCPLAEDQADIFDRIETEGPWAVFVPSADALLALAPEDMKEIPSNARELIRQEGVRDGLQNMILYHIVEDGAPSPCADDTSLPQGVALPTLLPGEDVTVLSDSVLVDGSGRRVNITDTLLASNGQVFVIDGVLFPREAPSLLADISSAGAPVPEE